MKFRWLLISALLLLATACKVQQPQSPAQKVQQPVSGTIDSSTPADTTPVNRNVKSTTKADNRPSIAVNPSSSVSPSPSISKSSSVSPSSNVSKSPKSATKTSQAVLTASNPKSRVNLRATPEATGKRLGYGLAGDQVQVLDKTTGTDGKTWYKVRFIRSNASGWIRGDLVKLAGTSQPSSTSKPAEKPESTPSSEPTPSGKNPIRSAKKGSCECPYDTDTQGRACGNRSAYSRPKGKKPKCYVGEG